MKTIACLAVAGSVMLAAADRSSVADIHRFIIQRNALFGFMDASGGVVIEPRFEAAQDFSEGLSAVRLNGLYGFVDTDGHIEIPAAYDYATAFSEGLALVYLKGKPLFIDKKGNIAFKSDYAKMSSFRSGRARVITASNKMGIINRSGILVVDTAYLGFGKFENGVAVAYKWTDQNRERVPGVIDETGRMIVPFGKYSSINGPFDGFFVVDIPVRHGKDNKEAIIDSKGTVKYLLDEKKFAWMDQTIDEGIIVASINEKIKPMQDYMAFDAYVSVTGKVIYDRDVHIAQPFREHFAFFQDDTDRFSFIDRSGNLIVKHAYDNIIRPGFKDGLALVEVDSKWGVIDTTGAYVLKPSLESAEAIMDGYIITSKTDSTGYGTAYGITDLTGKEIITPKVQLLDNGFVNGLLRTWSEECLTYFDKNGKVTWQGKVEDGDDLKPLNIDYLNRGYFYVDGVSTGHAIPNGSASNEEVTMRNSFAGAALTVVANSYPEVQYRRNVSGMMVYVANTTGDTIRFNAQDGRLYMKTQALDSDGKWQDIEYLPSSWCGNSYHSLSLGPNQYWTFVAPVYVGSFNTKLRIELKYVDFAISKRKLAYPDQSLRREKEYAIYSNTFEGSVNPAQFWRKPEYTPGGIMDPYND